MSEMSWEEPKAPELDWEDPVDDDDLKDNWDDEDEEPAPKPAPPPKKEKAKKVETAKPQLMTEEEKEKERQRVIQNLKMRELGQVNDFLGQKVSGIDDYIPVSKDEFDQLKTLMLAKITCFKDSDNFPFFIESFIRELVAPLDLEDVNKISTIVSTISQEKVKLSKAKAKPKGKFKVKVNLNPGAGKKDDIMMDADNDDMVADDYDFM